MAAGGLSRCAGCGADATLYFQINAKLYKITEMQNIIS